jgi:hypothetical protein
MGCAANVFPFFGLLCPLSTQIWEKYRPFYTHAEPSLVLPIRVTLRRSPQTLEMNRMSHCHDRNSAANPHQASITAVGLRHLSQLELARRWSISPRTLERWRWTGDGPRYIKLKGRVAYREADVEAYEAERLMESTQQPVQAKLVQS